MKYSVVIAADKSGSGKTTVTCGLISVLKKRGLKVQSFKCGPDYIDPMFHREVLGVPSGNLDSFFVSEDMLQMLYREKSAEADISIVEGVMGYYDGLGGVSTQGSTWEIAGIIGSPAVLVMDCKGASVSVAALLRGMLDFADHIGVSGIDEKVIIGEDFPCCEIFRDDSGKVHADSVTERNSKNALDDSAIERNSKNALDDSAIERNSKNALDDLITKRNSRKSSGIKGVILNRVSPMFYERLKGVIEDACPEIKVLGYLPDMPGIQVPSRHLGLVEPGDMADFNRWIEAVSEQLEKTVDIDGILNLAKLEFSKAYNPVDRIGTEVSEHNADFSKSVHDISEIDITESSAYVNISEDKSAPMYSLDNTNDMKVSGCGIDEPETGIPDISKYKLKNRVRLGIAEDEAFNFYYQENRELLEKMGAELVTFSPLHDEKLPEDIDGIIIGGGYPELYGSALEANVSVRTEISRLIKSGIPLIAECGGYMYLNDSISVTQDKVSAGESEGKGAVSKGSVEKNTIEKSDKSVSDESKINDVRKINDNAAREELICEDTLNRDKSFHMCGVFPGKAVKKDRLVRFGYVSAETKSAGMFGPAGMVLKGHEFHRYECEFNGDGFILTKPKAAGYKMTSDNAAGCKTVSEKAVRYETVSYRKKKSGKEMAKKTGTYEGVFYGPGMSCGWPHFYYYSNPQAIFNFLKCCERYRIERQAQLKWDNIGKPIDSLGVLEKHVVKLCGIQKTLKPSIDKRALVVLCGDHGCVREGVTQTDSSVTRKVADSFARGTMTTSYFARDNKADVYTIDVGMIGERYTLPDGKSDLKADDALLAANVLQSGILKNSQSEYHEKNGGQDIQEVDGRNVPHGSAELSMHIVNDRRLMDGTGDIAVESAMDRETGLKALRLGKDIVCELKKKGYKIIATGEMGIGNTTPTAALLAFFLGLKAEATVGYGAGLSEDGLMRKRDLVYRALKRLRRILDEGETKNRDSGEPNIKEVSQASDIKEASQSSDLVHETTVAESLELTPKNIERKKEWYKLQDVCEPSPREITKEIAETALFEIGGLEIAVMAGMFLGGIEYEIPVVIDGIISTAAALSAYMMDIRVPAFALASHISGEKAAKLALDKMGLRAIIDASMSLGEGSGAVLLLPLLDAAVNVYNEMGTFADIDVKKYQRL